MKANSKKFKILGCNWRVRFGFKCKFQNPLSSFSPSSLLFTSALSLHFLFCTALPPPNLKISVSSNTPLSISFIAFFIYLFLNLIHLMLNVFEIFIMGMKPSTNRVCMCVNGQGLVGGDSVRLCPLMPMFGC